MDIEGLIDILSRLADGEDVSVETEVTIKAKLSVNAQGRPSGPIHATIFFESDEGDEILFSAPIEKNRRVQTGPTSFKMEDLPLMVIDLETIPGVKQKEDWTITGHAY